MPNFPAPIPGVLDWGTVNLFGGSPHAGKTIELAEIAVRIRDGRPVFGHATIPVPIGIIITDHFWEKTGQWFAKVGWPGIPHVSLRDHDIGKIAWRRFMREPEERQRVLRLALTKLALPPGGLVFLDLGQPFITDKINDYAEVTAGIVQLAEITRFEFELTAAATIHMNKQKQGQQYMKLQERFAGSAAFVGLSDTILALESHEDTNDVFKRLTIQSRELPKEEHLIVHDPETGLFVPYTGVAPESAIPASDRPTLLLSLIPDDGIDRDDWYRLALDKGHVRSLPTFKRAVETLFKRGLIRRDAWGHYVKKETH